MRVGRDSDAPIASRASFGARLRSEAGIAWWVIVIIVVAVIVIAAIIYAATRPSKTPPQPIVCSAGELTVRVKGMAGAQAGQSYKVDITVTRTCNVGQANCACANATGSFGTPTTPCDSYAGNTGPFTTTDMVPPAAGIYTDFEKPFGNLQEGVYEVTVVVSVPGQPAFTRKCCVVVKSGQTSIVEYGCQRVGLPGGVGGAATCPDCTSSGSPGNPTGPIGSQPH